MEKWKKKRTRWILGPTGLSVALGLAALGAGLLVNSAAVSEGVRKGLAVCGNVLIPSLFPFMVLCTFLSMTDYARILSVPLRPVAERVFKIPGELGAVVLLSLIGGYPVGAKMISGLLDQGRIDEKTASRMLTFCVNSGPSFLISAVGVGLFRSRTAGVILFGTQTAATLIIGGLASIRTPLPDRRQLPPQGTGGGAALVLAVQSATSAMLAMCGFAILFSGILEMLLTGGLAARLSEALGVRETVVRAIVCGLLEVTSGSIAAAEIGSLSAFGAVSAAVSFGGASVLFQVMSCFEGRRVNFRPMLLSRLFHIALSTAMALPLYKQVCTVEPAWLAVRPPLTHSDGRTALISACLLAMCTIFLLSLDGGRQRTHRKSKLNQRR